MLRTSRVSVLLWLVKGKGSLSGRIDDEANSGMEVLLRVLPLLGTGSKHHQEREEEKEIVPVPVPAPVRRVAYYPRIYFPPPSSLRLLPPLHPSRFHHFLPAHSVAASRAVESTTVSSKQQQHTVLPVDTQIEAHH